MAQKSILIVDDDMNTVKSLSTLLKDRGYKVNIAYDGIQATKAAMNEHPDLVTMDMDMPAEEGLKAYIDLMFSPEGEYTPVLFLTGDQDSKAEKSAMDLGADGYLTKPFKSRDLLLMIYSLIGE
ncbi:MAG: response regulator [Actinobacteria bacterium]|nr:response regulator [Actinomycetota bacterium]